MDHQFDFVGRVCSYSVYSLFSYFSSYYYSIGVGLESLNRDHHARFKNATNHDTHREAPNGQSVYTQPQSSIEQLMNHQLCESILQNRFLLHESHKKLTNHNGVLTNFDGCGWPRNRRGVPFSLQERHLLQVGVSAGVHLSLLYTKLTGTALSGSTTAA